MAAWPSRRRPSIDCGVLTDKSEGGTVRNQYSGGSAGRFVTLTPGETVVVSTRGGFSSPLSAGAAACRMGGGRIPACHLWVVS